MIKVGLTGGIGSGKTTVAKIFEILKIPVFYADIEAKKLVDTNLYVKNQITLKFGEMYANGILDRKKLAEIVFSNPQKLKSLNSIVHPVLENVFSVWSDNYTDESMVIMEAAILFETGFYKKFDKIITVAAPYDLRIQRVCKRDKISSQNVIERINNQIKQDEKIKLSDFVIQNDDIQMIIPQVLSILKKLKD